MESLENIADITTAAAVATTKAGTMSATAILWAIDHPSGIHQDKTKDQYFYQCCQGVKEKQDLELLYY